ncbi:hypothetical protein [Propionivibrio sp.]
MIIEALLDSVLAPRRAEYFIPFFILSYRIKKAERITPTRQGVLFV